MFKKPKRVPRKIGVTSDDAEPTPTASRTADTDTASAVKRPTIGSRSSTKPKASSTLRKSLAFDDATSVDDSSSIPIQKPVKRTLTDRVPLPVRSADTGDRPSYSADYLTALKNSTPQTPANHTVDLTDKTLTTKPTLDIASKFGADALLDSRHALEPTTHIPTPLEIAEKKERRRRLAAEQKAGIGESADFISLNDTSGPADDSPLSDDEFIPQHARNTLILPASSIKEKEEDTRLIRDDDDMYENFESFTEDAGKVALGRRALKVQERERREAIEKQIKASQHGYGYGADVTSDASSEDDDVDAEEKSRIAAYELAQTRAGTYSTSTSAQRERAREEQARRRFETQPKIRQIPELSKVVGRFWEMVGLKEEEVEAGKRRLERVAKERAEMVGEEERIRVLLKEAGERLENLRKEGKDKIVRKEAVVSTPEVVVDEEVVGDADDAAQDEEEEEQDSDGIYSEEEDEGSRFSGLGSSGGNGAAGLGASMAMGMGMGIGSGGGLGFSSGMGVPRAAEDDW